MPDEIDEANRKRMHVAIIMDGNGRWAARRGLPRTAGHRAGVAAVRRVVERAPDLGIGCLTLYAFSADNWKRPKAEVESIFRLLRIFLRLETARLKVSGVRLKVIGRRDRLPEAALRAIEKAERATETGSRLRLRIAVDYSSREAITSAAANAVAMSGGTESLGSRLVQSLTADCGEVDLLIRTGGEKRLSDFLLWECAYAELIFTDCMWPDFSGARLEEALGEFRQRERRFGGVPDTVQGAVQASAKV
ncbi:MAG: di-trans,poly-cis-decaprenylcistransferase [Terracidiphilus sp.]